ncbi:hypothetical protein P8C59_007380 [Phyllachora maydis]|uniref:Uncharacterized protein n=1 Tax=Phyllachora maydis TaxID=1825666 RepID=A0AAD9I8B5_9PEZI|nr:hypothetical protein P8C59_007380 [Phyllachora maydis]
MLIRSCIKVSNLLIAASTANAATIVAAAATAVITTIIAAATAANADFIDSSSKFKGIVKASLKTIRRSKRTAGGNTGRNTTDSGLTADKDDNNAYNRAYMPPTNIEKEKGSSSNDNSINGSTSDSADKGKGSSVYERGEGALHYKDTLLYKQ